MNKKYCMSIGVENGYSITHMALFDLDYNSYTLADLERIENESLEYESDGFRQYSPFEFFANDMNDAYDPESMWEAYEEGVRKGADRAIREYKKMYKSGLVKE